MGFKINKRNRLKRIFNKTRNAENWENYRRNIIVRKFDEICKRKHANQKQFWKTIKPSNSIVLKEGNKIIKDLAQVAEILNDYYTEETESESPTIAVDLSSLQTKAENLPRLTLHKTNAMEVREVIQGINVNKATGYDGIPPRVIKASDEALCAPPS
jgi:hypothetical protein